MGRKSRLKKEAVQNQQVSVREDGDSGPSFAHSPVIALLAIMVIGCIAYANTLHSPFQWDDYGYWLKDNPIIRDPQYFLDPSKAKVFIQYAALKTRYIGYLTFALDYMIHGLNVTGYHIANLAIHILNAVLVYFLVLLTFRTPYFRVQPERAGRRSRTLPTARFAAMTSFFAALLFVSHPVQTEAVTYIFQRFASLVTLFYLFSVVSYIEGRLLAEKEGGGMHGAETAGGKNRPGKAGAFIFYALSVISAIFAMKTKENAFTLPVMIMMYEFLFFRGPVKVRMLRLIPWLLTLFIIPLTLSGIARPAGGVVQDPTYLDYRSLHIPRSDYLFTQFRVIVTYLRLLFLPFNQDIDYHYPIFHSFFSPQVITSFLFLLCLFGAGAYLVSRSGNGRFGKDRDDEGSWRIYKRLVGFGIIWFFVALSVESSIIPIPMVIDEYRLYLPSVGAIMAIATGATLLIERLGARVAQAGKAGIAVMILIAVTLGAVTYKRNEVWKGAGTLWADTVSKSPGKARPHYNLGVFLQSEGRPDEAIGEYQAALRLNPRYTEARSNLAVLYEKSGRLDEALGEYQAAMKLSGGSATVHNNLGYLYAKMKRLDEAEREFKTALSMNPDISQAHNGLGNVYDARGQTPAAIREYEAAAKLNPDYINAHDSLGVIYFRLGRMDDALREFKTVSRLFNSRNATAHCNIGSVYFRQGRLAEAMEEYKAALTIDPGSALAHKNLKLLSETMAKKRGK